MLMDSYQHPEVTDYGTLIDLTEASTFKNSDTPAGVPNSAFPIVVS
jgi:hypothetical protein